ncbi:hypothetical protein SO802_004169 [Lithocarpus litseifolius]|uniref:Uncharacterized protein n=1 Tax=Lithocarpus litseifolius TaxID=425828 RepID=A0AAW2E258_9ROSI
MQDFRDCQDFCGFKDLGYMRLHFTWCNRRFNGPLMWVRLDKALATIDLILKFPSTHLQHLQERNKRNFNSGLENERGVWVEREDEIGDMLTGYYSSLFTSTNPTKLNPVLSGVEARVSEEMNVELLKPFEVAEVTGSRVLSPLSDFVTDSKVCDLIDHKLHEWKAEMIDQAFLPYDAKIIKCIPLSIHESQDKQVWLPSKHGIGVIIRDSCGRVIGAMAERIPIPMSAAIVEA